MNGIPKITIQQQGIRTKICIDGKELKGIRGFSITQKGGQMPTLFLELLAADMTIDSACIPALPDVFKNWYTLNEDSNIEVRRIQEQEDQSPLCID